MQQHASACIVHQPDDRLKLTSALSRRAVLLYLLRSRGITPRCVLLHTAWHACAARRRSRLPAGWLLLLQQAHADRDAAWAHANQGIHDEHVPLSASHKVVQQRGAQPRLAHHLRGASKRGAGRAGREISAALNRQRPVNAPPPWCHISEGAASGSAAVQSRQRAPPQQHPCTSC